MVTGLYGEQYEFHINKADDDIRFGCLPYGFQRDIALTKTEEEPQPFKTDEEKKEIAKMAFRAVYADRIGTEV